ncbi:hypothetical protein BJ684DRAFT_19984 [Piptocephalis cylindrospora]|uniref:Uncharacterized protein n=1 Tax=Piptocephalis cylindrospora TaxID=1907219 RepID=A0A4P9Y3N2_9FUNG|nr:hypothetical protein BJ684DRAFT_19984 [Piptocephalis cylindrospora]|eukprot:RKP13536.1 hypothetical protein BJ684DRAFT_19984 [Piptocephalis cylindrospora]
MHLIPILLALFLLPGTWANTEKVIFHAGSSSHDVPMSHYTSKTPLPTHPTILTLGTSGLVSLPPQVLSTSPYQVVARWFAIRGLDPEATYEARVSYPASSPTDFTLHALPASDKDSSNHWLYLEAIHTGVRPPVGIIPSDNHTASVLFTLAVEKLILYHSIPRMALSLTMTLIPCLLLTFFFAIPALTRLLSRWVPSTAYHLE